MAFKFVIISCLVAVVRSAAVPTAVIAEPAPVVVQGARLEELDSAPQYVYEYNVVDINTGDVKGQFEKRDGSVVTGRYYLDQPDGLRRIVDYFADAVHGFNARVTNEPLTAVVEPVAPVTVAEPAARVIAPAPVAPEPVAPAAVAPAPILPRFTAAFPAAPASLARYATYPSLAQFAVPYAYPGASAQFVVV